MKSIMLVCLNYYDDVFSHSKVKGAVSRGVTPLGLLCVAAPLVNSGHAVKIVDLNLANSPDDFLRSEINAFRPDIIGITATTPLIYKAYRIASLAKSADKRILVVVGGPHASALPEEVLSESEIDCAVTGEGDFSLTALADSGPHEGVPNIYFKKGDKIVASDAQDRYVEDLDSLPFPAYHLLEIEKYRQPRIASRKAPMGYFETSRGCYGRCIFCDKNIHGRRVRMKSPDKVVSEMERMIKLGFREIQIIDDIFTADIKRAHDICEGILKKGLKFDWYPRGGIRVDRADRELFALMKKAGCYRIPFGIESGSQRILDIIDKRVTLGQAEEAVKFAKEAGMETEAYFMIGNPTETEEDIKKSIDFAIKLDTDYAKFAVTIPFPGTALFDRMSERKQIKSRQWDRYNFAVSPKELYEHDVLSWDIIDKYYDISHREFYFRPLYIGKIFRKMVADGTVFEHVGAFLKTRW
ncbi:MAG: radical SAM protein [Candidatus Omnitrophica bacterium]|nr:radical SAM protein [Candidatus Omnitrophota bacterium]